MGNGGNSFIVLDPDGNRKPDAAEDVLRYEAVPLPPDFRIRSSVGRPQLRYLPDGRSAGSNLTVRICLRERLMSEVVVNNGGRARSRRAAFGEPCRG
ncbi:GspH/FimT family protein [Pseudoxanthomonas beigongshangi]